MIAPEPAPGINPQTSRVVLLRNNLLVVLGIFTFLQIWRPCFFLTDDNFDGFFPVLYEIGHRLMAGHSPFCSDYLFGGHYEILRDPVGFIWSPIYLVGSLVATTRFYFWTIDAIALVLLLVAAAGFVNLAHHLRRELNLTISDGWIMFYTQSFTFSMIALATGASWLNFLGDYSALPWLALGILLPDWRRSLALIALFCLHLLLAGHLASTTTTSLLLTFFALGMSLARRSTAPLACWLGGYALAVLVILPLMLPMTAGFLQSGRSHGVILWDMQANNIPWVFFFVSLFLGAALWYVGPLLRLGVPNVTYVLALGSSAAAWCLLPALASRAKWRPVHVVTVATLGVTALLICRPEWLSELMLKMPLLRSLRWPCREMIQFQFFLHLFLVSRPPGFGPGVRWKLALLGASLYVLPVLLFSNPPTFNPVKLDRALLFSGRFDRYWDQVRLLLHPGDRVAVLIPREYYDNPETRDQIPYSLLNTYNYAILSRVINTWGYSPTAPSDQFYTHTIPVLPFGAYETDQKAALAAERPELVFIELESISPLKITLDRRDGHPVDLTPLIPPPGQ